MILTCKIRRHPPALTRMTLPNHIFRPARALLCLLMLFTGAGAAHAELPVSSLRVVKTFPHDPEAFTQGLVFHQGVFYESTGLRGKSTIRKVDPQTGRVLHRKKLNDALFGEGLALYAGRLFQLTLSARLGIIYGPNLDEQGRFHYATPGWGLCADGASLILSNGSPVLLFLDPNDFRVIRTLRVTAEGKPVRGLNELEMVRGEIWANIWPTERGARIDPATGRVKGWIDFSGLLSPGDEARLGLHVLKTPGRTPNQRDACPNGIAWDAKQDRIFVTGKLWPTLYEVELAPAKEGLQKLKDTP